MVNPIFYDFQVTGFLYLSMFITSMIAELTTKLTKMLSTNKHILYIFIFFTQLSIAQNRNQVYQAYINQYYKLAIRQQKEHNIPASIVLAQGLLESGAGISDFARQSNNHFGIKCNNDWIGATIYHDDDKKGECFRKYENVLDSYEDHALFLKNRQRYAFLFYLAPYDYEGWAHGLKKAGYATDPTYAFKLISIIEDFNLHRFDVGEFAPVTSIQKNNASTQSSMGFIHARNTHSVFRVNGVKFITSSWGDTYASIAEEFNLTPGKICEFNELDEKSDLQAGMRVYIEQKKTKAPRECETHVVEDGESMYSISQDYGIKVESIYQLNKIPFTDGVSYGQMLKLR